MELSATYKFAAPPQRVWELLMDTPAICGCLPGCRELKPVGDDRYQADLSIGVASVSGVFAVTVAIVDTVPPRSYRLVVDGTGKPGFVRGSAAIVLNEDADGTTSVVVTSQADVGGLIARVGQRLIEGVGKMTMDRFFGCLAQRV